MPTSYSTLAAMLLAALIRAVPGDAALALLSLTSRVAPLDSLVSVTLGWAVVSVVVYRLSHLAMPTQFGFHVPRDGDTDGRNLVMQRRNRPLRAVFSSLAVLLAIAFVNTETLPYPVGTLGLLVVLSAAVLVGYLRFVDDWELFALDGRAASMLDEYVPYGDMQAELEMDREREGWLGWVGLAFWVGAVSVVVVIPCFVSGVVAALLWAASPMPELLLLGLAVVDRSRATSRERRYVEDRAYEAVASARADLKSATLVTFAVVGGLGGALSFSVGLKLLRDATALVLNPVTGTLSAWNLVGGTALVLVSGGYALWFWVREFDRIGGFLDVRRGEVPDEVPPRVRGWTVLPTLGLVVAVVVVSNQQASWHLPAPALVVGWLLTLATFGVGVRSTYRTSTRVPAAEDLVVGVSLSVQASGVWVAGNVRSVAAGQPMDVVLAPELVFLSFGLLAVVYLPDAARYATDRDGRRRYVGPAYLLGFGAVVSLVALVTTGRTGRPLSALAAISITGALALAGAKRLEG